jgi:hypothetical protein
MGALKAAGDTSIWAGYPSHIADRKHPIILAGICQRFRWLGSYYVGGRNNVWMDEFILQKIAQRTPTGQSHDTE